MNDRHPAASGRETAVIALALLALMATMLWLTDGAILFTRPLWVDEWLTVMVASHASPADVLGDLRHGADGGASLFHLMVWLLRSVTGTLTPTVLRAMSLVFVWGALCLGYVVLRRRFSRDASLAGVLAVGAHDLVVAHAFEARFYGPWLFCCALYAWSLTSMRHRTVKVAVAAILLTTIHWYGIFTLGLMAAAVVLAHGRRWREGLRLIAPSAAGIVAFLAIAPLAAGQRAAVSVNSWIPDFRMRQVPGLLAIFWTATIPKVAAAILVVGAAISWRKDRGQTVASTARQTVSDPSVVALLSLAAMPLVVTVLSMLGQPSMIGRYAIVATLAWAPFVAYAVELVGGRHWPARALALGLIGLWFVSYTTEVRRKNAFAAGVRQTEGVLRRAERMGIPVVFQSMHTMYPQAAERQRTGERVRARYLDLPDSTLDVLTPTSSRFYQWNKGVRLERDFARVHAARFGFPVLAHQAALDSTERFVLIATPVRLPRGIDGVAALATAAFPRHRVVALGEDLLLLERTPAPAPRGNPR